MPELFESRQLEVRRALQNPENEARKEQQPTKTIKENQRTFILTTDTI